MDGQKTSDYVFRAWMDSETDHLMVECHGKVFKPKKLDIHYVDELVLEPGGLGLWSYTVEKGESRFEQFEGPKRFLVKVSDDVLDPPTSRAQL